MLTNIRPRRDLKRSRGIALVMGLIFLMLLTLIGTTTMSVSTQQERASGNSRDYLNALEAAEAGLRDCESILQGAAVPLIQNTAGLYDFVAVEPDEKELWQSIDWADNGKVRVVQNANATWPGGNPRCLIEAYGPIVGAGGGSLAAGRALEESGMYRVASRAQGLLPGTVVLLLSTYAR